MRIDFSHNYADVSKRENGTYFVKLNFPEVGMYINGIRVVPAKKGDDKFIVYKPAIRNVKGEWKTNYEYENTSEMLLFLQELALKAVDEYEISQNFEDIENLDIDAELDKAFGELEKGAS